MTYKKYKQGNHKEPQKDIMDELFNKIKEGVRAIYSSDKWKNIWKLSLNSITIATEIYS